MFALLVARRILSPENFIYSFFVAGSIILMSLLAFEHHASSSELLDPKNIKLLSKRHYDKEKTSG